MDDPTAAWNYQAQNRCAGADQLRPRRANPNLNSGCCNAPVPHKGYSNNHSAQVEGGPALLEWSRLPVVLHLQPRHDHQRYRRL